MPEQDEVEVKFALADPAQMRANLLRLGAVQRGSHVELNIRLDDAERSLSARRIVLRRRRVEEAGSTTYLLTVKTPGRQHDPALSIRREIELTVSDGDAMLAGLEVLGYRPYWRYEKRRETFALGQVEAVLDEMPFGWFVELEGLAGEIRRLVPQLGLDLSDGITESYAELFDRVRQALDLDINDLTFEAFADIDVPAWVFRPTSATGREP